MLIGTSEKYSRHTPFQTILGYHMLMNGHATNDILKKMTIGYQGIGIGIGIIVEKIKNLRLV